ncbi:MAG: AbrB/MazE/SpoVT family DNA-binding domain-containing protein [Dehalococcoidia bacterium]|nr:AbrB/MazE/SpoVT family DNA-binding domain-containing protein [Dehalococcoidia bacterium]
MRVKAKVTAKGQITLPKAVRDRLGIREGDAVYFVEDEHGVHVEPDMPAFDRALEKWRGVWRDDPLFKGKTTDEIIEEMRGR